VLRQVVEPKVSSVVDQHAENAAAVGEVADLLLHLVRHPVGNETLEPGSCWIDHAQRCVVGIGDTGGGLDDPLQNAVERQFGVDCDPGIHEHPEAVGPFPRGHARIVSKAR
jgi:hypothetical protein